MELTKKQIEFLDNVCGGRSKWKLNSNGEVDVTGSIYMRYTKLTKIPVKFGSVGGYFVCSINQITSLENAPTSIGGNFLCHNNQLTNYFKTTKEEDFPHWNKLNWG